MMMKESAVKILLLTFVTCGIYGLIWLYKIGEELRQRGADIPAFWQMFVPILSFIWLWKWAQGVEQVSGGRTSAMTLLLVYLFFFPAAIFMVQGALQDVN